MSSRDAPIDLLVVGWYPGADDPIAGRFIADQVAALRSTGRVCPSIASFEPFQLDGDLRLREVESRAWSEVIRDAARDHRAFAPRGATAPDAIPVARLGTPRGGTRVAARTHQAVHRAAVLDALLGSGPGRPDLLHAHVGYPDGAAVGSVARASGIPMVLTEHASYIERLAADPDIRAAYLAGARTAARIVAVSRVLADRVIAQLPELTDRLVVIPNAVEIDAFRLVPARDRDPDELLWVGYRDEGKGIPALILALQIVRLTRPGARLRMVGRSTSDEDEATWRGLAAGLGLGEAVSFDPPADRSSVARAMERAAVFVHPSRSETMGIVAVEALATGLPVVAVDSGGVTEILGPDPSALGALVGAQEPEPLAAAILETLARRDQFDPSRLRAHVVDRYAAPAVAERLADLYDDVLASAPGPSNPPAAGLPRYPGPPAPNPLKVGRPILLGLDRAVLDRTLQAFPDQAIGDVLVITSGGPVAGHPDAIRLADRFAPDLVALLGLQGRARRPGALGLVTTIPRWLARQWRRRRLVGRILPALSVTLEASLNLAPTGVPPASRPLVVCLGGIDVMAVEPFRAAGRVVVAPGGARWLGDWRAAEASAR